MTEHVLVHLAGLLMIGIGSQWLAWRLKIPSIVFLLISGFVAGPVTGFIKPDELFGDLLLPVVSLSVAIILFEGGLTLRLSELKSIGKPVLSLVTIGAALTWGSISIIAYMIFDLHVHIAVLLGAILVVTGPTVIGPLLRFVKPTGKVADILKWEGIVIDPIGAMLAILVFEAVIIGKHENTAITILYQIGKTFFFGSMFGLAFSGFLIVVIRKFWIPDFLHESVTLSLVIAATVLSNIFQAESGLIAATLMGIVLANQKLISVKHIIEFKENLRILIISVLFILLAARLDPNIEVFFKWENFFFLGALILVVRPVAVLTATLNLGLSYREIAFLSWMAPRGIVAAAISSIFNIRLMESGIPQSDLLVPLTFMVIMGTIVVYGLTAMPLAKWLKLTHQGASGILIIGGHSWALELAVALKSHGFSVAVVDINRHNISRAKMAGITAYYNNALDENLLDTIKISGFGRILAMLPNDETNSLVILHFAEMLDRQELYQLTPDVDPAGKFKFAPTHLHGRFLFNPKAGYSLLTQRFQAGAKIKSTPLTDTFDYSMFQAHYRESAIPLCLINEQNQIIMFTTDSQISPKPGQTLISMVDFF